MSVSKFLPKNAVLDNSMSKFMQTCTVNTKTYILKDFTSFVKCFLAITRTHILDTYLSFSQWKTYVPQGEVNRISQFNSSHSNILKLLTTTN